MNDQKELYMLWNEYLKRSENYREFCEWWRKKEPVKSLNIDDSYRTCFGFLMKCRGNPNLWPVPNKFKRGKRFHIPETFGHFLDVHMFPFEEWWLWKKGELVQSSGRNPAPVVNILTVSGRESLEADIDYSIESLRMDNKREPLAIELKEHLLNSLEFRSGFGSHFLKINLDSPPQEIKAAFAEYLESKDVKRHYDTGFFSKEQYHIDNQRPSGNPRPDDLQDYLDAYDMWKEKVLPRKSGDPSGWNAIIQHFVPGAKVKNADECAKMFKKKHSRKPSFLELQEILEEEQKKFSNMGRKYKRYKENAVKIISNVEKGYFPGKY